MMQEKINELAREYDLYRFIDHNAICYIDGEICVVLPCANPNWFNCAIRFISDIQTKYKNISPRILSKKPFENNSSVYVQLNRLARQIEPPIKIDEYEVIFSEDGINVGCKRIPFEKLEEIYNKAKEIYVPF